MIRLQIYKVLSIPVFLILYSYTVVIVFLTLILAYLKLKNAICYLLSFWAKTVFPLMGKRLHIEGKEFFERKHKYILLANHSSMFDIIAIMAFYPEVSWFGHERLFRIPLIKQMLLMTDYIPMRLNNVTNTREMLTSGGGYGAEILPELQRHVEAKDFAAKIVQSEYHGHASEIAAFFLDKGYTHFIAVGGDGTMNEVAKPLIGNSNVTLGLIPAGTGNDFIQILGFPDRFSEEHWNLFFQL